MIIKADYSVWKQRFFCLELIKHFFFFLTPSPLFHFDDQKLINFHLPLLTIGCSVTFPFSFQNLWEYLSRTKLACVTFNFFSFYHFIHLYCINITFDPKKGGRGQILTPHPPWWHQYNVNYAYSAWNFTGTHDCNFINPNNMNFFFWYSSFFRLQIDTVEILYSL